MSLRIILNEALWCCRDALAYKSYFADVRGTFLFWYTPTEMCQKRSQIKARRIQNSSWSLIIADILLLLYIRADMAHQQRSVSIIGLSHNKHRQDKHLLHLLGYFSPIEYMIGWFLKERLRRSPSFWEYQTFSTWSARSGCTIEPARSDKTRCSACCLMCSLLIRKNLGKKASHGHGP